MISTQKKFKLRLLKQNIDELDHQNQIRNYVEGKIDFIPFKQQEIYKPNLYNNLL